MSSLDWLIDWLFWKVDSSQSGQAREKAKIRFVQQEKFKIFEKFLCFAAPYGFVDK